MADGGGGESAVLTERHGAALLVTLNRPAASNALDAAMLAGLAAAWREAARPDCRAVVVTGAGRNFCAGADLGGGKPLDLRTDFHPQCLALAALEKPVIAAVNGAAAGGGLGIALAADIRILAEDARLVPGWVQIGLVPDLGASWFAARLLGEARTFEWFAGGEAMSADRALALGVAGEVARADALVARALARAQALAGQPGSAVALTKLLLAQASSSGLADQLELEATLQRRAFKDPARGAQVAARIAAFRKDPPAG